MKVKRVLLVPGSLKILMQLSFILQAKNRGKSAATLHTKHLTYSKKETFNWAGKQIFSFADLITN